jgi:hypothetical protein
MGTTDSTTRAAGDKPVWQTPKLHELGNIRRLVQTGNAYGKSGGPNDGNSTPGGESMV